MSHHITPIAGCDIAKDTLQVALHPGGQSHAFQNKIDGHNALLAWLKQHRITRIAYEPTGPYHRNLERHLADAGLKLIRAKPHAARHFAKATGLLAKTDRLDAQAIAVMANALDLPSRPIPDDTLMRLRDLLTARRALIRDRTANHNRLAVTKDRLLHRQLSRRIKAMERDIGEIDNAIAALIKATPQLARRVSLLCTIPGIGPVTARALVIDMPELGTLTGRQAASLAGLAPVARDSGRTHGKRFIRGGRAPVRKALYMPAVTLVRAKNSHLGGLYQALRSAGKPAKVALVALMRRLLVIANAILRDDNPWQPQQQT